MWQRGRNNIPIHIVRGPIVCKMFTCALCSHVLLCNFQNESQYSYSPYSVYGAHTQLQSKGFLKLRTIISSCVQIDSHFPRRLYEVMYVCVVMGYMECNLLLLVPVANRNRQGVRVKN